MTSATLLALPAPSDASSAPPSMARIYVLEAWYELLKMLRQPSYSVPTIGFPVMFYVLFGALPSSVASPPGTDDATGSRENS